MFKENKDGQTHYVGDGCTPPHEALGEKGKICMRTHCPEQITHYEKQSPKCIWHGEVPPPPAVESWAKEFDKIIGEIPDRAIMEKYGKEFCLMCGHPTKNDKTVLEIKSFIRQTLARVRDEAYDLCYENTKIEEKAERYDDIENARSAGYKAGQSELKKELRSILGEYGVDAPRIGSCLLNKEDFLILLETKINQLKKW